MSQRGSQSASQPVIHSVSQQSVRESQSDFWARGHRYVTLQFIHSFIHSFSHSVIHSVGRSVSQSCLLGTGTLWTLREREKSRSWVCMINAPCETGAHTARAVWVRVHTSHHCLSGESYARCRRRPSLPVQAHNACEQSGTWQDAACVRVQMGRARASGGGLRSAPLPLHPSQLVETRPAQAGFERAPPGSCTRLPPARG